MGPVPSGARAPSVTTPSRFSHTKLLSGHDAAGLLVHRSWLCDSRSKKQQEKCYFFGILTYLVTGCLTHEEVLM